AGNYTFTSTVGVTTVNANTQGTVTFNGNVTGALVIQDTATVAFAADDSITGAITTDADGQGTLTFATATAATTLVSGNVGVATTGALLATTVNTGAGITSTLGGQVNSDTITVAGTGTLAITGAVTATTTLDITGAATVTLAENLTTGVLDFNAVSTVTVAANKIITGNVDAGAAGQGTLTFAATTTDSTLVSGSTGIVSNSLLAVNVAPASGVTGTFYGCRCGDHGYE
ncbi:MAG: hypothetical protein JKY23_07135, partial [Nitrospinaceae bacterium]|nr:hypothetical protein [Nitrospinaceae bacterium]